jgi:hypothetical protein
MAASTTGLNIRQRGLKPHVGFCWVQALHIPRMAELAKIAEGMAFMPAGIIRVYRHHSLDFMTVLTGGGL